MEDVKQTIEGDKNNNGDNIKSNVAEKVEQKA